MKNPIVSYRDIVSFPFLRCPKPKSWLAFGVLGWYLVVWRGGAHGPEAVAALPYTLLLAGLAGLGTALGLQSTPFLTTAAGTVLFLISDLLLAAGKFRGLRFPLLPDLVWLTYGPAQLLIVLTVNAAFIVRGIG